MHDDEVGFVGEQRLVSRRSRRVDDVFLERCGGEPGRRQQDGFGFGEVDLAKERVEDRLEKLFQALFPSSAYPPRSSRARPFSQPYRDPQPSPAVSAVYSSPPAASTPSDAA